MKTLLLFGALVLTVIPSERRERGIFSSCLETSTTRRGEKVPPTRCARGRDDNGVQAGDTTITIRASGSTLEYDPPKISVKNGRRVRLRFVNEGTLPHNIVVPRNEDDLDALVLAAYESSETGYVPVAQKDKLVGFSRLASPGETVEVSFIVPPPGEYKYVCLFPGHANSMLGTLRSLK